MSSLVRYWVSKRRSKTDPTVLKEVSHFRSEPAANDHVNSEFFKSNYGEGVVEVVSFSIYDTAEEAEADSLQRLRESGLAKLKMLTKKEAMALGIEHLLSPPEPEELKLAEVPPVSG